MNDLLLDFRHALRSLRKNPGFTAVVVLTLALAIGATTTIFAVVDAVIIRPLPFAEPGRLVQIRATTPQGADFTTSDPDFLDLSSQNRTLVGLAAYRQTDLALTDAGDPRRLQAFAVSQSLFPLLGVGPAVGRNFLPNEDAPHATTNVVVVSHALWVGRFGGDSGLVGRTITLNGHPYTVIGIMPATLHFPEADAFVPLRADPNARRGNHWLNLVGRLRVGATVAELNADLDRITTGIGAANPTSKGWGARAEPLANALVDSSFRRAGWVLLAATGLLLLLACANIGNLLLARATGRQTEMGVRAAIGADRNRLMRQWLTESGVLVIIAAALGLGAAVWGTAAVQAYGAGQIPRLQEVGIDGRVVGVAIGLSILTTLACGLVPALRASRVDPASVLGDGARGGISRRQRRVRDGLVVFQIALSIVLLVGAGLMVRSFGKLATVDVGFDAEHVLAVQLNLPEQRYDEVARATFYTRLTEQLRALPGVRAVGATSVDPFSGMNLVNDVTPEDRAATTAPTGYMQAGWRSVTPGFFAAMGIAMLRGRPFTNAESQSGPPSAIITRSLASRLWPDADPVGKGLFWGGTTGTPLRVIGVVNDIRDVVPQTEPMPMIFLSSNQVPMPAMTFVVRSGGDPTLLAATVTTAIHTLDPVLPVDDIHPLTRNRADVMAASRFNLTLMSCFALLALLLAASGIYSVIAFNVAQRHREIGIRLAMGAAPSSVVNSFLRSGILMTALGLAIGLVVAWIAARSMGAMLYGVAPNDALTFTIVPAFLAAVAVLSTYLPARRAADVAPMDALRGE